MPVIYATQAEVDAGSADGALGTNIVVIDGSGVPTGVQYAGTAGAPSAATGATAFRGTVSSSTFPTTGGSGSSGELEAGNYWTLTTDVLFTATSSNKIEGATSGTFQGYGFDKLIVESNTGSVVNWSIIANEVGYVPEDTANKGSASGYAPLDSGSQVPAVNLPIEASTTPVMDGSANVGTATTVSASDHVHPTDTSRAASGANSDITSLSGLTTPLDVPQGGLGVATLTQDGVVLGNTVSGVNVTAAGTADQVFRVPGAGGAPAFGAVDLSKAAAVTGILPRSYQVAPTVLVTTNTIVTADTQDVIVNAAGGAVSVTLPAPSTTMKIAIKKINSAATPDVTIIPASGTIDGVASKLLHTQNSSLTITSDGTNYFII